MLSELNPEKVCFIIVKAREFDVQDEEPIDDASDPADDKFMAVFTDTEHSSVLRELQDFIEGLNVDEQNELIALCLIGRGDFSVEEWKDAIPQAKAKPAPSASAYLLRIPTVSDFLEEGLSLFGFSCEKFEEGRL